MYPVALLEALGGFDESFSMAAGEDTDLAYRALRRGATIGAAPDAIVEHAVHPSSLRAGLRSARRLDGLIKAVERHPDDLRRYMHGRVFWFAAHGPALLAAGGLLASTVALLRGRPRTALAWLVLAVPYARHRLFVEPLTRRSRVERVVSIPMGLLVDLVDLDGGDPIAPALPPNCRGGQPRALIIGGRPLFRSRWNRAGLPQRLRRRSASRRFIIPHRWALANIVPVVGSPRRTRWLTSTSTRVAPRRAARIARWTFGMSASSGTQRSSSSSSSAR